MLAQVFIWMILNSWEYLKPEFLNKYKKINDTKEISRIILEEVLKLFAIRDIETFRPISKEFEKYFYE